MDALPTIELLTYPAALAIVFALMFVTTFTTLLGVRRRLREQDGNLRRLAELVTARPADTPAPTADLSRLEGEIGSVNERLAELLRAQLEQVKISGPRSLNEATGCAREGLAAADIASRCGISLGEAELLVRLHGPNFINA